MRSFLESAHNRVPVLPEPRQFESPFVHPNAVNRGHWEPSFDCPLETEYPPAGYPAGVRALWEMSPDERRATWCLSQSEDREVWLEARKGRVTMSKIADLVGMGYSTIKGKLSAERAAERYIEEKLWPELVVSESNWRMEYGSKGEDNARLEFEVWLNQHFQGCLGGDGEFWVEELGLVVPPWAPWLGASPDGIIRGKDNFAALLEIKMPTNGFYGDIPPYYYFQIQFNMAVLGLPICYFVEWTQSMFRVSIYEFNRELVQDAFRTVERLWFTKFVPSYECKQRGALAPPLRMVPGRSKRGRELPWSEFLRSGRQ